MYAIPWFVRENYIPFVKMEILGTIDVGSNPSGINIVTDFILKKSTKTLDAVCLLCRKDFAEDALVLGRTLMELCLRLRYIAAGATPELREMRAQSFIYDSDRQRQEKIKTFAKLRKEGKCEQWLQDFGGDVAPGVDMPTSVENLEKLKDIAAELGGELECQYHFVY